MELSHINSNGEAVMVDISDKSVTKRTAKASGRIYMKKETIDEIAAGTVPKGDVLAVARIAGIMAAKRTDSLIPMCHSIPLDSVNIDFKPDIDGGFIEIVSKATCTWKTGVEMEALTAVSVAALTIYDMCKAIDKSMHFESISLIGKTGGKTWVK